jgi:hypothetical protein
VSALNFCEVVAFSGRPFSFEVSLAFQDWHGVSAEVCIYSKLASRMFPPASLLASSLQIQEVYYKQEYAPSSELVPLVPPSALVEVVTYVVGIECVHISR